MSCVAIIGDACYRSVVDIRSIVLPNLFMDSSNMPDPIELAAFGWEREDWLAEYYPEDLPPDWRLGFYANEYRNVLVPMSFWSNDPDVDEWPDLAEKGLGFYFYIDGQLTIESLQNMRAAAGELGAGLQGVVLDAEDSDCAALQKQFDDLIREVDVAVVTPCADYIQCWQPGLVGGHYGAGIVRLGTEAEPRALRQVIEQYVQQTSSEHPILFVDAPPEVLKMLRTLLDLMGL
jgi:hypothetical protein